MRYSEAMRVELEAGTDAATLLIFDPAALPPDYDRQRDHDPLALHEALAKQGRVLLFETGADGIYRLHLYVDEPVPADVRAACQSPITVERFKIPSGRLYFTGAEYGFQRDDAFLRAYPQMGASAEVEAGEYHLSLYRVGFAAAPAKERLRGAVERLALRLDANWGAFLPDWRCWAHWQPSSVSLASHARSG